MLQVACRRVQVHVKRVPWCALTFRCDVHQVLSLNTFRCDVHQVYLSQRRDRAV